MNAFQENHINYLREVPRTKDELDKAFENVCCGLKDDNGKWIMGECFHQATCVQHLCPIYKEYVKLRDIIDDVRRPRVIYVDNPDPRKWRPVVPKEKNYKIKPKVQCRQICKIQIAKMVKKITDENTLSVINQVAEHVEGFRFKRAYNLCVKNQIDNLANTLEKFINN